MSKNPQKTPRKSIYYKIRVQIIFIHMVFFNMLLNKFAFNKR